ncbi:hypothetical protein THAOC_18986, partial [Thalassiosira oceanica]
LGVVGQVADLRPVPERQRRRRDAQLDRPVVARDGDVRDLVTVGRTAGGEVERSREAYGAGTRRAGAGGGQVDARGERAAVGVARRPAGRGVDAVTAHRGRVAVPDEERKGEGDMGVSSSCVQWNTNSQ